MSLSFALAMPGGVKFGNGVADSLPAVVASLGRRVVVVTGSSPQRHDALLVGLRAVMEHVEVVSTDGEPTVHDADRATKVARDADADVVISLGGGSVMDVGKAVAMLLGNGGQALDYLEVVGGGNPIVAPSAAHVAVPTTAGTGAEVTANAVLMSPEHGLKASLRSPSMIPTLALVDPSLTRHAPAAVVAASGMDALTQCIEPFVSRFANPVTDGWAREGIARAASGLRRAVGDPSDEDARTDMSLCSLLGGLSLANAKLGAVHGFAGPIGGMLEVPHGSVCGALLGPTIAANVEALRRRDPGSPALQRYDEVGRLLTGRRDAVAADAVEWVELTRIELGLPGLASFGLGPDRVAEAVTKAAGASSMRGNPITLTDEELTRVLTAAL